MLLLVVVIIKRLWAFSEKQRTNCKGIVDGCLNTVVTGEKQRDMSQEFEKGNFLEKYGFKFLWMV